MAKTKALIHNNFFLWQFSNLQTARSFFEEYLPANVKESIDWSIMHLAPAILYKKRCVIDAAICSMKRVSPVSRAISICI